ncbi:MAG: hypothetical protein ACTHMV_08045 [Chitinophagaceae bacterium]
MKRKSTIVLLLMLFDIIVLNAQWVNSGSIIYTNGRVGINTTNPSYALHSVSNNNTSTVSSYLWGSHYGTAIGVGNISPSYYAFSIEGNLNADGTPMPNTKKLFYVRADGNIGIGTDAVTEKLNLAGNLNIMDGAAPKIQILNRATLQVPLAAENGYTRSFLSQNISWNSSAGKWDINDLVYRDFAMLRFENSGTIGLYTGITSSAQLTNSELGSYKRFGIDNTGNVGIGGNLGIAGNVGIGTDAIVDHKLAVNGSAIFTKVKVKQYSNWPDYVFNDNYPLRSLTELATYIRLNKRLPDMPAADEVEKKGLDLADNQAALLKKIEELTLYILDQQKEIESLKRIKEDMTELRKEMELIRKNQINKN